MTQASRRLVSVDAFRALTMFLMIFVNDLWTLTNVPAWLEHATKTEDRLGFSDIIFPAFLFIVGLSIPFAISGRTAKGYSRGRKLVYILNRSLALLVMGIFQVNLENYDKAGAFLPKAVWQIGVTTAFFLIWLDYSPDLSRKKKNWLKGAGVLVLVVLALLYRGLPDEGDKIPARGYVWMEPQWYGILGLIGWSYLLCALIYLFAKDRWKPLALSFLFFIVFLIVDKLEWLDFLDPVRDYVWIVSGGAMPAITMAGVLVSVLYRKWQEKGGAAATGVAAMAGVTGDVGRWPGFLAGLGVFAVVLVGAGFAVRPIGGISKIEATPSWALICTGISIGCFILLAYIVDIKGRQRWIRPLRPAGTSTLTAYMLPYFHYAVYFAMGETVRLPYALRTGGGGILKSLLYALLIIWITGLLEKRRIRLSV